MRCVGTNLANGSDRRLRQFDINLLIACIVPSCTYIYHTSNNARLVTNNAAPPLISEILEFHLHQSGYGWFSGGRRIGPVLHN